MSRTGYRPDGRTKLNLPPGVLSINNLTQDEQFLLQNHRDMVANKRYGEVVSRYETGRLVMAGLNMKLLPPGQGNGNGKSIDSDKK